MDVTIDEIEQAVGCLRESELAYRLGYNNITYFVYHTRTYRRERGITIALPLKPCSNVLFFDNHLSEEELLEKLKKL